jgi:hypothetical protein
LIFVLDVIEFKLSYFCEVVAPFVFNFYL